MWKLKRLIRRLLPILALVVLPVGMSAQTAAPITTQQITMPLLAPVQPASGVSASVVGQPGINQYWYWVVANYPVGNSSPSFPASVTQAPSTLGASNYVFVAWSAARGASTYDLLRTSTGTPPTGACNCAVATGIGGTAQKDTSNSLSSYSVVTYAEIPNWVTNSAQIATDEVEMNFTNDHGTVFSIDSVTGPVFPGFISCANMPALTGDTTSAQGTCATTTAGINNAAVPASTSVLATNASAQVVAATAAQVTALCSAATASTLGCVQPDGVTLANAAGAISVAEVPFTSTSTAAVRYCALTPSAGGNQIPLYNSGCGFNTSTGVGYWSGAGAMGETALQGNSFFTNAQAFEAHSEANSNFGVGARSASTTVWLSAYADGGGNSTEPMGFNASAYLFNALSGGTAALAYMCVNAENGQISYDSSGTCAASLRKYKNVRGGISPLRGLWETLQLKPSWYSYKPGLGVGDTSVHGGFIAEDVQTVDPRLASYAGGELHGVRTLDSVPAIMAAAIQAQQLEIDSLFGIIVILFGCLIRERRRRKIAP